jgi:hypothetical protein
MQEAEDAERQHAEEALQPSHPTAADLGEVMELDAVDEYVAATGEYPLSNDIAGPGCPLGGWLRTASSTTPASPTTGSRRPRYALHSEAPVNPFLSRFRSFVLSCEQGAVARSPALRSSSASLAAQCPVTAAMRTVPAPPRVAGSSPISTQGLRPVPVGRKPEPTATARRMWSRWFHW